MDLENAENLTPEQMLAMLRVQAEYGADECLMDDAVTVAALNEGLNGLTVPPKSQQTAAQNAPASVSAPAPVSMPASTPLSMATPAWHEATSLDALRAMAEGFNGCDLKKTASNMVFSDGNPEADIMLIGEAPGADEDRQGKPFVGASGQLLDKMLASIHLDRTCVYISNIIPWRPPGNRTPTNEEVAMFLPMIKRHIELAAPKILITLGGSSTKALLSTAEGILKLRGEWREFAHNSNTMPMMAMLHPAYLLRTPQQKSLAWKDLRALYHKGQEMGLKFRTQNG